MFQVQRIASAKAQGRHELGELEEGNRAMQLKHKGECCRRA